MKSRVPNASGDTRGSRVPVAANPLQRYHEAVTGYARAERELRDAEAALAVFVAGQRTRRGRSAAVCGTEGGYYRHVRTTRTPACEACKFAHREAERYRADQRAARQNKAA